MPDFERLTRDLELHLASKPEENAFVRGKQLGEDTARWQIAKVIAVTAAVAIFIKCYLV